MTRVPWHEYGLALAEVAATRSEDPYRRVGAVVFRFDWSVLSVGYNGGPPGVELDWSDRTGRRDLVIHAEMNALRYATRTEAHYLCSTHQPCEKCLPMIAAYGIQAVFFREEYFHDDMDSRRLKFIADKLGIRLIHIPKEQ